MHIHQPLVPQVRLVQVVQCHQGNPENIDVKTPSEQSSYATINKLLLFHFLTFLL